MTLCKQCSEIDFRATGLHASDDPDYNFFALDDISYLLVLERINDCVFCKIVFEAFIRWVEVYFRTLNQFFFSDAAVGFSALRTKSLTEIDIEEISSSVTPFSSLFRIFVSFTIKDPYNDVLFGLSFEF